MNKLISVVVTSYNHAEYLDQRITSLLKQTYSPIEIIIVDDASTDNSRQVIDKYRASANVQIFCFDDNRGYAYASNYGANRSRGEYIVFAECDDFSQPEQIAELVKPFEANKSVGVVFSRSNMVDERGAIFASDYDYREKSFRKMCRADVLIPNKVMLKYLLGSCVIPNMSAAMIKKECFEKIGGLSPEYKVCADWDQWCRLAKICDFYYLAAPLNNFRNHRTTARSVFSCWLQLAEYYDLLYKAVAHTDFNLLEKLRFKIKTGGKWAAAIASNPVSGINKFEYIYRESWKVEKLNVLYLALGLFDLFGSKLSRVTTKRRAAV